MSHQGSEFINTTIRHVFLLFNPLIYSCTITYPRTNNWARFCCLRVPSQSNTLSKKIFYCLQLHQQSPTPKILSLCCLTAELHQNWRILYSVTVDHCFLGLSWRILSVKFFKSFLVIVKPCHPECFISLCCQSNHLKEHSLKHTYMCTIYTKHFFA